MKRLLAAVALVPLLAGLARAETFTVTKLDDTDDGVCDADCSLREALDAANAIPGADVVELGPGVHRITIRALEIEDDLELAGAGMDETALEIDIPSFADKLVVGVDQPEVRVAVRDLSLPGVENLAELELERVRVYRYGVWSSGRLEVHESEVLDSSGGGITNAADGVATVSRTLVARNRAFQSWGASGGGILNRGTMTVSECIIEGNASYGGSGISNDRGALTVEDSIIRDNHAGESIEHGAVNGRGAGIANERDSFLRLERVTVADNVAGGLEGNFSSPPICGGIYNRGELEMVNVTVSGNSARSHLAYEGNRIGGGPGGMTSSGTLTMTNVTFSRNLSGDPPDTLRLGGDVTALNVLVDGECEITSGDETEIVSLGGNLESPGDGCGFDDPTDLPGVLLPGLDGLEANGGFGGTHALLAFSPALDGGVSEGCPDTDQRGVPRADGACDIGAFEYDPEIDAPPPEEPPEPEPPPVEPPEPEPTPAPPSSGGGGGGGGCAVSDDGTRGGSALVPVATALLALRRRRPPVAGLGARRGA